LAFGDQCCTDQISIDKLAATKEGLCGLNYSKMGWADVCRQTHQEGSPEDDCPDHDPLAKGPVSEDSFYIEPGCCTVFGRCGALSLTGDAGCYVTDASKCRLCVRSDKNETIGVDPLSLEDYGNCSDPVVYEGNKYTFCAGPLEWKQAHAACEWKENRHLVHVDDAGESALLRDSAADIQAWPDSGFWLGASESTLGQWRWTGSDKMFFSGRRYQCGVPGSRDWMVVDGYYVNWAGCENFPEEEAQPFDDLGEEVQENCAQMRTDGYWSDEDCAVEKAYVCEEKV
jgi:hypothetical protein